MSKVKDAEIALRNRYADMSVRQLLYEAADPDAYLDDIEEAIREAVLRESSLGVLAIPSYGNEMIIIDIVADTERHDKLIDDIKQKVPPGKYYLIPKESV
jgi:hypothetical protein